MKRSFPLKSRIHEFGKTGDLTPCSLHTYIPTSMLSCIDYPFPSSNTSSLTGFRIVEGEFNECNLVFVQRLRPPDCCEGNCGWGCDTWSYAWDGAGENEFADEMGVIESEHLGYTAAH